MVEAGESNTRLKGPMIYRSNVHYEQSDDYGHKYLVIRNRDLWHVIYGLKYLRAYCLAPHIWIYFNSASNISICLQKCYTLIWMDAFKNKKFERGL